MRRTPPDQNLPPIVLPPWRTQSAPEPGLLERLGEYGEAVGTICHLASGMLAHLATQQRAFVNSLKALADAQERYGSRVQAFWSAHLKELGEFKEGSGWISRALGPTLTAMEWLGPIAIGLGELSEHRNEPWYAQTWHAGAGAGLSFAIEAKSLGGSPRVAAVDAFVGVLFPGANPTAVIKSSLEIAPGLVAGYAQAIFTSNTSKASEVHQRSLNGEFGPVFQAASGLGDAIHGDFRGVTKFEDEVYNGKHGAAFGLVSSAMHGFDGLAHFDELSRSGGMGWFAGKCNETGQIVADVIAKPKTLGNLVFGW
jgi:hypothetical protein